MLQPMTSPVNRILIRATSRMLVFLVFLFSRWSDRRVCRPERANLDNFKSFEKSRFERGITFSREHEIACRFQYWFSYLKNYILSHSLIKKFKMTILPLGLINDQKPYFLSPFKKEATFLPNFWGVT